MLQNDWHYFEAHVTIEPVFDERLEYFKSICSEFKFHVADLLMRKRKKDNETRSNFDSFCTGKDKNYDNIESRMFNLIDKLNKNNYHVWRYKIESTLLDSKYDDSRFVLNK